MVTISDEDTLTPVSQTARITTLAASRYSTDIGNGNLYFLGYTTNATNPQEEQVEIARVSPRTG